MEKKAVSSKPGQGNAAAGFGDTALTHDSHVNEPKAGIEPKKLAQTEEFAMEPKEVKPGQATQAGALNQTAAFNETPQPPAKPAGTPAKAAGGAEKTVTMGDYKLIKKLGQGGMGAVFKAVQISLDREVALKVLSPELANKQAFVERFKREAKVMARLDHPNILRCFGAGQHGQHHWLAMEFVEGGSVENWLKKLGKFSVGDATHIVIACANALQHAHEQSLVHRDIKPDNILLTKKGVVKVADLGLAKATDDDMSLTQTGTGAGTPLYMAPEQARDVKNVDARCDIFALGCVYYCLLAGAPPFKGETLLEVIEAKEKNKYTPLRKVNDEVPDRLELIIGKMMAKSPQHRYQDCAAIVNDLEEMGIANDRLSFIEGAVAAPMAGRSAPSTVQVSATKTPAPASTLPPSAKKEKQETGNFWYVALTTDDGKTVKRKMSTQHLEGLIRSKVVNAKTEVSRSLDDGYRALATYGEFVHLMKTSTVTEKAEKSADKFRQMVQEIDKQDARRKRWRWLNDLLGSSSKMLGGALWIFIVLGLLAGGAFLFVKFVMNDTKTENKKQKKAAIELRVPANMA